MGGALPGGLAVGLRRLGGSGRRRRCGGLGVAHGLFLRESDADRVGQVVENEWAWGLSLDCVREAAACAAAKGIKLLYPDPIAWVGDFTTKIPDAMPSMYQDVQAGRVSEIGSIHGGVVAEGEKLGVPTPTCAFMVRAVSALQEKNRVHGAGSAYNRPGQHQRSKKAFLGTL